MRVKKGEIYIAADRSKCGHIVLDVETYKQCDDVVTQPFDESGLYGNSDNRIDKFKLTQVRYMRCDENLDWFPEEIFKIKL